MMSSIPPSSSLPLPPLPSSNSMEESALGKKRQLCEQIVLPAPKKQMIPPSPSSSSSSTSTQVSFVARSFPPAAFPPAVSASSVSPSVKSFPAPVVVSSPLPPSSISPSNSTNIGKGNLGSRSGGQDLKNQIANQLWIWEQLIQREQSLFEKLKHHSSSLSSDVDSSENIDSKYLLLQQEFKSFLEHKMKVLMPLVSDLPPSDSLSSSFAASSLPSTPIHSPCASPSPSISPSTSSSSLSLLGLSSSPSSNTMMKGREMNGNAGMNGAEKKNGVNISMNQQPLDVIIANRYIVPAPSVLISLPKQYPGLSCSSANNQMVTLVVCASLYYHLTDKEVAKTMDGKQDILQGVKRISIDLNGMNSPNSAYYSTTITFSKLKILEVSSKHKHQPFSLVFSIEEYTQGSKRIMGSTKSTLFQVLSRPTSTHYPSSSPSPSFPFPSNSNSISNPQNGTKKVGMNSDSSSGKRDDKSNGENPAEGEHNGMENKMAMEGDNSNMILQDITDLLTLPQKEAATKLGISESMLCKRFKESTRRKWPYRYLRKLEKVIKMLHLQDNDGVSSKEDREKLDRLEKEKEECLRPVKIRITANDRITNLNASSSSSSSTSTSSTLPFTSSHVVKKEEKNSGDSSNEEEEDREEDGHDEDHFVLETLEMLKSQRSRS